MLSESAILVLLREGMPGLVDLPGERALVQLFARESPSVVIYLECTTGPTGGPWSDWRDQTRNRFSELLSLTSLDAGNEPTREWEFLARSIYVRRPGDAAVVHMLSSDHLLYVSINTIAEPEGPSPLVAPEPAIGCLRDALLKNAAENSGLGTGHAFGELVHRVLFARQRGFHARALASLGASARAAVESGDSSGIGEVLRLILSLRVQDRQLRAVASQLALPEDPSHRENDVTDDLDAVAAFLTSYQLLRSYEQSQQQDDQERLRQRGLEIRRRVEEDTARKTELRLARYAAALIMPSIYVDYWSTATAPESIAGKILDGPLAALTVVGGAILVAIVSWWITPIVYRRPGGGRSE